MFLGLFKPSILSFYTSFPQISIACVFENKNLAVFRSLRTLRALRPLRAISRLEGMRVNKRFCDFFSQLKMFNKENVSTSSMCLSIKRGNGLLNSQDTPGHPF